ncbi:hypothetical protein [Chryseobacterium caseinilyticum]|uniref:LPS export ABC transporter periplasmic protein LptC n=1 Tax=Chryseobacterium caseinilyticum TaxID=2771428 RepID=A0ABR8Z762_9FLAO|nr:hypothetical protein [Chryseobacterium caseinilyticum]MBD8081121.1 hypothetical protein [Chryseobacterium caseinilyticum]
MKNKIIIISLIFVIAVLVLNSFYSWVNLSPEEKLVDEINNPKTDTIRIVYNSDSTIVKYLPNVGQNPVNNITRNYNTYVSDTLGPALKIAKEDIFELQQVRAKLEGTVKSQKSEIDLQKTKVVFYQDKYFSAKTKTDTVGNSTIDYKYNAQIDIVTTKKKKNLFAKDVQEVSITSPDKNLRINGVEHFKKDVSLPSRRFGIGIQAGYYYVPEIGRAVPGVGVGLSYNPIKF